MATKQRTMKKRTAAPKECAFCKENTSPTYGNVSALQKYVTDRGKIVSRSRNGLCAKHQRRLTTAIKHARHLALLPFVGQA